MTNELMQYICSNLSKLIDFEVNDLVPLKKSPNF